MPVFRSLLLAAALVAPAAHGAHAVALFGQPKYPADFQHFAYVNPDAPKGGSLSMSLVSKNSSFDKYNPYSLRGTPAPGLLELVFETLTINGLDEINTQYGLLAEDIAVAPDFGSVVFRLRPQARFSNGDPVTAADVAYSFETLTGGQASPRFKAYFAEIERVVALDERRVRFDFRRTGRDLSFIAGSLPVFSAKWGLKDDGSRVQFDQLRFEAPIASGPYRIERAVSGRGIVYRRDPAYWAADVPVRRGSFNFERIEYKLYKDRDTQVAALRSGDYDFIAENQMRYWCCQYIGKRFDDGELVKRTFPHRNPPAMNGWVVNLRKPRFQDPRVREALNYALDFEWINDKIFDGEFERVDSYFANSPLAARGLPSAAELELLEPFRDQLPPAVFGPMYQQPSTRAPSSLRANLTRALELFAEAGWHHRDGVLRNAAGEPFVLEVAGTRAQSPYLDPVYLNLSRIGVVVKKRLTDAATAYKQMSGFDFDYSTLALREARMPGDELWRSFNSAAADRPGSENLAGVKSPAVDTLIKRLLDAQSQDELETAAHALDRVLIHNHYVIPWRYLTRHYFIYNQRLRAPQTVPLYYGAYEWTISSWWDSDARPATVASAP
ncbi:MULTISPECIES: extracellular solute-binding protein [unclassified Pseudomonas]|uniref:extracellular solute-binding protein n=1 Tax=unclassified Pseudomonas TaxID=196821 RepID=UPI00244A0935|nr:MULTISPECIES: extracellular solute-binding protein [unclassified Pseudomonas]MDG9930808.1 extracellular solute-binding protein [Pseudomonas sp. GD04042]MDH0485197.1 extracellular solute-binding protein [Pseudomonas sp. GD04015]MDH0605567.1 extracellular solute-binding protein [Pseudomonas sp. GD03869]